MSKKLRHARRLTGVADAVIIRALDDAAGILADAARLLAMQGVTVSRSTLSRHVADRPDLQDALRTIQAGKVDFAERVLWSKIEAGDAQCVRYFLSTLGKDRGFSNRTEITTPPGKPVEISSTIDWKQVPQDELRILHVLLARRFGKKAPGDDDFVARGLIPPREAKPDDPHTG
jgi:hypothetical protein